MKRISLRQIEDAITDYALSEVRQRGSTAEGLWHDNEPLMDLIRQYGQQREREGRRAAGRK